MHFETYIFLLALLIGLGVYFRTCFRQNFIPSLESVLSLVGFSVSWAVAFKVLGFVFTPVTEGEPILLSKDMAMGASLITGALTTCWFGARGMLKLFHDPQKRIKETGRGS